MVRVALTALAAGVLAGVATIRAGGTPPPHPNDDVAAWVDGEPILVREVDAPSQRKIAALQR